MKTGEIFSRNLRSIREEQGFTQKALALKVGLNDQAVRDYEAGRRFPSVETLGQIAEALGVKVADLFESSEAVKVLQMPVSKTIQKLASIPDNIYDLAVQVPLNSEAWETAEIALKLAIKRQDAEKEKAKSKA